MAISLDLSPEEKTSGWKNEDGFTIYTTHLGDSDVLVQSHGIPVSSFVVPVVNMQYIKRDYLGMFTSMRFLITISIDKLYERFRKQISTNKTL